MRRSVVACSLMSLAVGVLAGCPDRSIDEVKPQQGRVEAKDIPVVVNRDLDLIFVIDDSPSMADKQANLADNFPKFIDVLNSIPGGLPNVHIGVVTSDMGTQGLLDSNPNFGPAVGTGLPGACSGTGKDGAMQTFGAPVTGDVFISDIADPVTGVRTRNYPDGQLAQVFAQMARGAGARGCGFEQHLAAAKRALTNPVNQKFFQRNNMPDNAFLAVIIIADEDDCSLAHYSLLADDANAKATLGAVQSFRCTRFGVTCDQNGKSPDAMNQVGTKGQCHPNDDSPYLAKVNDFVTALRDFKKDPNKVIVAGIMGTTNQFAVELRTPPGEKTAIPALAHSCTYIGADINGDGKPNPEVADPPTRLQFFLNQFPNRSTFSTICQKDLSGGLQQIGDLLKTVIGDPCIEGKLENFAPAGQPPVYDCSVSYVSNPGDAKPDEVVMPKCTPESAAATNQPCWHIAVDTAKCPTDPTNPLLHPDNLALEIEGQNILKMISNDLHVKANCVTQSQ